MALLAFWKSSRDHMLRQSIQQIVSNAGDGKLRERQRMCQRASTVFARRPKRAACRLHGAMSNRRACITVSCLARAQLREGDRGRASNSRRMFDERDAQDGAREQCRRHHCAVGQEHSARSQHPPHHPEWRAVEDEIDRGCARFRAACISCGIARLAIVTYGCKTS
jgi:hypothetical protein